jgi:hypothetical protein
LIDLYDPSPVLIADEGAELPEVNMGGATSAWTSSLSSSLVGPALSFLAGNTSSWSNTLTGAYFNSYQRTAAFFGVTQAPPALKPAINPGPGASQIPSVAQPPTLRPVTTLADAYANARAQNLYNVELQPGLTSPTNYSKFNTNYLDRATGTLNMSSSDPMKRA